MKIGNGIRIATTNKNLWLKTMLSKVIVLLIISVLIYVMASLVVGPILQSQQFKGLLNTLRELVGGFFSAPEATLNEYFNSEALKSSYAEFRSFISSMSANIVWVSIVIILLIQLMVFIFSMFDYVIGVNINDHMSSMLHSGYLTTLFDNFKMACRYAGFRTLLLFCYNFLTFIISISVFSLLAKSLGFLALSIAVLLIFVLFAIRLTIFGLMLPIMVCENKGAFVAFKDSLKLWNLQEVGNRFLSYTITILAVYVVVVISGIVTFNVSYLITLPLSSVVFKSLKFVDYYTVKKKKYYLTFDEIVVPKELRLNDEQLLNKIDI